MKKLWFLIIILFAFLVASTFGLLELRSRFDRGIESQRGTHLWLATEVKHEYLRFLDSLNRYTLGDSQTTHKELMLRLDLFWAQASNFKTGSIGNHLMIEGDAEETIARLFRSLEKIEPLIKSLKHGDVASGQQIRQQLSQLSQPLHLMTQKVDQNENSYFVSLINTTESTLNSLSIIFLLTVGTGIALILLLIIETKKSGKLYLESIRSAEIIKDLNANLEKKVQQRTFELKEKSDALLAANTSKSRFFATMSHEVRTPLNGIIGLSHTMTDRMRDPDLIKEARLIHSLADTLLNLLNNVLDHSQFASGSMSLKPIITPTNKLLANAIKIGSTSAHLKGIHFLNHIDASVPPALAVDPVCIDRILVNLVNNACKFTTEGSISIKVTWEEDGDKTGVLSIHVQDTGPGIPEEIKQRLKVPVDRISTTISSASGSGLGLSLVNQMVKLHSGTLSLDSSPGTGTHFTVNIPCKPAVVDTPTSAQTSPLQAPDIREWRLLVVDDNAVNRLVAKKVLAQCVGDVSVAESGKEALELTDNEYFDLILMDWSMPEMDGLEAAACIRSHNGPSAHSLILCFTAHEATPEAHEACAKAGMDGILVKPLKIETLTNALIQIQDPAAHSPKS